MEQITANARQASIKYKQVESSWVSVWDKSSTELFQELPNEGLYVELNENKCEGMIPMRDLDDDYYEFDEKNYCLRGKKEEPYVQLGRCHNSESCVPIWRKTVGFCIGRRKR